MFTKTLAIAALVAFGVEARFGQEQCSPALADIQAVTSGGEAGQAATIAGGAISDLLAAANPCDQLTTADEIVATLGTGDDAIQAAKEFLNCEKNFNPFVQSTPTLCSDASLPSTAELRGVLPKIDPSVGGADVANDLAATSLETPFDATGKSIADIFAENGFTNFTTKDAAGNTGDAPSASTDSSASTAASNSTDTVAAATATDDTADDTTCDAEPASSTSSTDTSDADTTAASNSTSDAGTAASSSTTDSSASDTATGTGDVTNTVSTVDGVDFGLCNPGMKFESGINGRAADEFTFQAADDKISAIQGEALNFNIITNRICDELTNQCEANDAAKTLCADTQAAVANLGRVRSTADTWNTMLGFDGQDTNPDGTSTEGEPTE